MSLLDVEGDVQVESVNGDLRLERIASDDVEASTVSGAVLYQGTLRDDGRYRFASHTGDLTVVVPDRASAAVSVSTFNGDFDSSFPVQLQKVGRSRSFDFVLGSGRAELELESFSGSIRLQRPGEPVAPESGARGHRVIRKIVRIREER